MAKKALLKGAIKLAKKAGSKLKSAEKKVSTGIGRRVSGVKKAKNKALYKPGGKGKGGRFLSKREKEALAGTGRRATALAAAAGGAGAAARGKSKKTTKAKAPAKPAPKPASKPAPKGFIRKAGTAPVAMRGKGAPDTSAKPKPKGTTTKKTTKKLTPSQKNRLRGDRRKATRRQDKILARRSKLGAR